MSFILIVDENGKHVHPPAGYQPPRLICGTARAVAHRKGVQLTYMQRTESADRRHEIDGTTWHTCMWFIVFLRCARCPSGTMGNVDCAGYVSIGSCWPVGHIDVRLRSGKFPSSLLFGSSRTCVTIGKARSRLYMLSTLPDAVASHQQCHWTLYSPWLARSLDNGLRTVARGRGSI